MDPPSLPEAANLALDISVQFASWPEIIYLRNVMRDIHSNLSYELKFLKHECTRTFAASTFLVLKLLSKRQRARARVINAACRRQDACCLRPLLLLRVHKFVQGLDLRIAGIKDSR